MGGNVVTRRITAAGAVTGTTGQPMKGAHLNMIAGNVTVAGLLRLRDGGVAGTIIYEQALPAGGLNMPFNGSIRFVNGVYAEFASSLAGDITLYFG